jgi:hypothetical protein
MEKLRVAGFPLRPEKVMQLRLLRMRLASLFQGMLSKSDARDIPIDPKHSRETRLDHKAADTAAETEIFGQGLAAHSAPKSQQPQSHPILMLAGHVGESTANARDLGFHFRYINADGIRLRIQRGVRLNNQYAFISNGAWQCELLVQ